MKRRLPHRISPRLAPALAALLLCSGGAALHAATYTWDGGDTGNAGWNRALSWVGDTAPVFNNEADLIWHAPDAARLGRTENAIVSNQTIRSLTFNDSVTSEVWLRLTNGSGGTVARLLTFEANSGNASVTVATGASGNITVGAAGPSSGSDAQIRLASNLDIIHNGTGLFHFDRIVDGSGTIHKTGTGIFRLSAANQYTGGTTISGGTLEAWHASALGTGGAAIQTGGTLSINQGVTLANTAITLQAGGTLQRAVNAGQAYTLGTSGTVTSSTGGSATGAALLQSDNAASATTLTLTTSSVSTASNDGARLSDVINLDGTASGDRFVLELSISSGVTSQTQLMWFDADTNQWVNAVLGNDGGDAFFAGDTAYDASHFTLGTWGIDTAGGTVWAVLNHQGDFAIATIPEPSTWVLLLLGVGAGTYLKRRRS